MALELSLETWKLGLSDGRRKPRVVQVAARDYAAVLAQLKAAKDKLKLPTDAPVRSCYEAGREGFSVHRALTELGIDNIVINSASLKVSRAARRAKTDRLDALQMVEQLVDHHTKVAARLRVVQAPRPEAEDLREHVRELKRLKNELTRCLGACESLLFKHGHRMALKSLRARRELAQALATGALARVGPFLTRTLQRTLARASLLQAQIKELVKERKQLLEAQASLEMRQVAQLMLLSGCGFEGAWMLVLELFGWRRFKNRRELASFVGLVPVPHASGKMARDLGLSRSGSPRLRALLVELAWLWLRYQPESELSLWFQERFSGSTRTRRTGIVALARKILIVFWKYLNTGEPPRGAKLRPKPLVALAAA
ncbi:MAG: IS110 family transposase [Myxococcales bacterium]|nr:IS110 family transposase [Myxococcales bacterium]